jgi:hypothetical protein
MRYGVRTELAGVSQQQYEAMHRQFSTLADDSDGLLVHVSGPASDGWYVLEVWESKADAERFMQKARALIPPDAPRPRIEEFEVFNCEVAERATA